MRRALLLVPFALSALGCDKVVGSAHADEGAPTPPKQVAAAKSAEPAPSAAPAEVGEPGTRYGVPFGWEISKDEPLAKARSYLGDVLKDNAQAVGLGKTHFIKLADEQSPRATVVTCADARVQANAWDDTPENDAYTVRNLGNQIAVAHGSVEYGVEHLHTPVLLVLGHTGCDAVKAAMGKLDALEPPIKAELSGIKVPAGDPKKNERQLWADAVVANVNQQVDFAVTHFGKLLREQRVVVVGAVYDLRNDLGKGYGRLSVVNVNGNTEPKRLKAFESALATASSDPAAPPELVNPGGGSPEAALAQLIARNAKAARGEASDAADHDEHAAEKPAPGPLAARETKEASEPHGTRDEKTKPAEALPKAEAAPKTGVPRSIFDHKE